MKRMQLPLSSDKCESNLANLSFIHYYYSRCYPMVNPPEVIIKDFWCGFWTLMHIPDAVHFRRKSELSDCHLSTDFKWKYDAHQY